MEENTLQKTPIMKFSNEVLPFQLSAPQHVLLPVHQHWEVLIFSLFDGVGASGDGSHLPELKNTTLCHTLILHQSL